MSEDKSSWRSCVGKLFQRRAWSGSGEGSISKTWTTLSQNVPPLTYYNLNIHYPIRKIFGRSVTEKVRNQTTLCFLRSHIYCFSIYIAKEETQKTAHWCIVRATQSKCWSALDFLSSEPCPHNSPELNALITRFGESYSSERMSRESKRLKKSSSDWLNSGNALK